MSYKDYAEKLFRALYEEEDKKQREIIIKDIILKNLLPERINIRLYYDTVFSVKNLEEDIDTQLDDNFKDFVKYLFMEPINLDCLEINKALNSFKYDRNNLFEFLTARPYQYKQKIKEQYQRLYNKDLEKEIKSKFSGELSNNIISILNTERSFTIPQIDAIKAKVEALINSNEKEWVKNFVLFNNIFVKSSPKEIVMIGRIYYSLTGKDFLEEIKHPLLKEIVYNCCKPSELYARKLHSALRGFYTNINTINRIMATRDEVDLPSIINYYYYLYKVPLTSDFNDKISGIYKELLIELLLK